MITEHDRNAEEGFTLLELVVGMCLFSMLTIGIFALLNTATKTQATVQSAAEATTISRMIEAVADDVRVAVEVRTDDDGDVLYLLTQDNELVVWEMTEGGFTNGSRTFTNVQSARFAVEDGMVRTTIKLIGGEEATASSALRFPQGAPTLTDDALARSGELRQ